MKKLFLFATVAAAGLFAGCSSSDDTISDVGASPIENVDGDKAPIKIGLGDMGETTRGTGTVGGVKDGSGNVVDGMFNVWAGQRINVFMFTKDENKQTTLNLTDISTDDPTQANYTPVYLYNDTEMITPGSSENKIPGMDASLEQGEAMIATGDIKYYPNTGNFDFFGYHVDDAAAGNTPLDASGNSQWTVDFAIDGTQDLMSTKAKLTTAQEDMLTSAEDFYSAKAARKGVQPILSFKHLLTRLTFKVKAGNPAAAGWGANYIISAYKPKDGITAAQYNDYASGAVKAANTLWEDESAGTHAAKNVTITLVEYAQLANDNDKALFEPVYGGNGLDENRAVKVDAIFIKSKTTGKLLVAWTGAKEEHEKIEWATGTDQETKWLTLKERPAYQLTDPNTAAVDADIDAAKYAETVVAKHLAKLQAIKAALEAASESTTAIDDSIAKWNLRVQDYRASIIASTISEESYNLLNGGGQGKYTPLGTDNINADLVPLTSVAAQCLEPANYATSTLNSPCPQAYVILVPVGEALLVAPNATDGTDYTPEEYEMEVRLSQMVPTNWNTPNQLDYKTSSIRTSLKWPTTGGAGAGAFKINNSYNVNLTVYGFNRIEVTTEVKEWKDGGEIAVGQD